MGKTLQGSPPSPSALPGAPSILPCSSPVAPLCPVVTQSHAQSASRWDGHGAQGTSGEPRDARTRHAHLFPFPFSPVGK